jgi:alpha-beta hydrolase superfamily lysophospholipase
VFIRCLQVLRWFGWCLLAVFAICICAEAGTGNFYDTSGLHISASPGTLLRYEPLKLPFFYRAKAWRILYATRDHSGRPVASSGVVVLSGYAPPAPKRRIVAWTHPTTGTSRKCAPSLRSSPIDSISGINDLITGGYIVVATDFPGLGTDGPFGLLIGKSQGQAVIDSVRAARQVPGVGGSNRYALWGYSLGGHSALFAGGMSATYAPELSLVAVAAAAPPTDLDELLNDDIRSVDGRILAAMVLSSWSKAYGVSMGSLVDNEVGRIVAGVNAICIDDLGGKLSVLTAQKPLARKFLNYDPNARQPWKGLLQQNSLRGISGKAPVFISQGADDKLVRSSVTKQFVRRLCRSGTSVTYNVVKEADHESIARLSAASAIAWIGDRFAGNPSANSCALAKT